MDPDPGPVTVELVGRPHAVTRSELVSDGSRRRILLGFLPAPDPAPALDELVLLAHDVLGEGVIVGDGSRILHVNDATCGIYGFGRDELLSMQSLFGLFRPDEQRRIQRIVEGRAERGEPPPERYETVIVRGDGAELAVEVAVKAVVSSGRMRTLTIVRDDSLRRRTHAELTRLAFHDPLTGLPNRMLFMDRVERTLARFRREGGSGALLYLDLDGFKAVNDGFGHGVGDQVLTAVADRLRGAVRDADSASRLGGDEFAVLCEDVAHPDLAARLGDRMAAAVEGPVATSSGAVEVRTSIGWSMLRAEARSGDEVLRDADRRMYLAKHARREGG